MVDYDMDDLKQAVEESGSDHSGTTNMRLDKGAVESAKAELGVSQNTQIAPLLEAACHNIAGDEEAEEEAKQRFKDQFNNDEEEE